MRALLLSLLTLSACSVTVDTENLSGGTRPASETGVTGDGATDSGTCGDPEECLDDALVVRIADLAPCTSETTDKFGCRKKVAESCRAKDPCCFKGGYGPVAFPNPTEATILCLVEPSYEAPVSEILGAASGCTASALASRACDYAVHVSATKRGKNSGILQSVTGDTATVIGLEFAEEVSDLAWADLTALDAACTLANAEKQACTNAVQRYCTTGVYEGGLGGLGPLKASASGATVVCF